MTKPNLSKYSVAISVIKIGVLTPRFSEGSLLIFSNFFIIRKLSVNGLSMDHTVFFAFPVLLGFYN